MRQAELEEIRRKEELQKQEQSNVNAPMPDNIQEHHGDRCFVCRVDAEIRRVRSSFS
jgi:hypothetical protein